MKTELRFTDDRVPHIAIVWDQRTEYTIRIDGQNVDAFTRYGNGRQGRCTVAQAKQVAREWFDEVSVVTGNQ